MERKRLIIIIIIIILFLISILISKVYYEDKFKVSFETGTDEEILTSYVKRNSSVEQPKAPKKEGYVFIEWQLNGEKYDFNSKITKDIVLTAKWIKEEYITISYETDSPYNIEDMKILKGSTIEKLPVAVKDGYDFVGWYLNDKLYDGEIINDDANLIAHYELKLENKSFKIGDKVVIIGSYSNSAYSTYSPFSIAIGWNREILGIFDNSNYPYMVGNKNGVTGFFKADSIQLIS